VFKCWRLGPQCCGVGKMDLKEVGPIRMLLGPLSTLPSEGIMRS
jgi:hypothetical protein